MGTKLKDYVLKLKGEMENFLGCPIEIVEDENCGSSCMTVGLRMP